MTAAFDSLVKRLEHRAVVCLEEPANIAGVDGGDVQMNVAASALTASTARKRIAARCGRSDLLALMDHGEAALGNHVRADSEAWDGEHAEEALEPAENSTGATGRRSRGSR
ncbi:MAG: hypothetical protein WBE51_14395 [Xanthobacteraceae bacterium]